MNTRDFIAWADQQHIERLSNPACHESYDPRLDRMNFWLPDAAPAIPSGAIDLVRGLLIPVETAQGPECISWPISPGAERRDITGGRHGLIIQEAREKLDEAGQDIPGFYDRSPSVYILPSHGERSAIAYGESWNPPQPDQMIEGITKMTRRLVLTACVLVRFPSARRQTDIAFVAHNGEREEKEA